MSKFSLWPLSSGFSTLYSHEFDPRITNEFSTAAFRLHTLVPNWFQMGADKKNAMTLLQGFNNGVRIFKDSKGKVK